MPFNSATVMVKQKVSILVSLGFTTLFIVLAPLDMVRLRDSGEAIARDLFVFAILFIGIVVGLFPAVHTIFNWPSMSQRSRITGILPICFSSVPIFIVDFIVNLLRK